MAQKMKTFLLAVLYCVLLSSCGQKEMESTASHEETASAPPSTQALESQPVADTQPVEGPTVLSEILGIQPEELNSFTYYDSPKLYYRDDGAVFPEQGAGATTFDCGHEFLYKEEQDALTRQFAQALAAYRVGEAAEVIDGKSPLPSGRYFTVWPSLQSEWEPVLTFFDSGEVYVDVNGGMDGIHRYWQAEDPAQFDTLLGVLKEIHVELNGLPLDYQLSMWLRHDTFKPASTALRLAFVNNGKDVVTADSLFIERKAESGWERIGEAPTPDLAIAPHRAYTLYAIDLTAIPNARQTGNYRVTGTLKANGETLPLELTYTIAEDAEDLSSPPLPKMTPENADYCERYIGMWGLYSPFDADFDEENYTLNFHPFHLYRLMAYAEGKGEEYDKEYGVQVPGEILEDMIQRHFLLTREQIRAWMPTKEENDSEYYDAGTNTYHFAGGYGGVGYTAVVTGNSRDGDKLTLTCDWYDYEDNYRFSQEFTLLLGEGEYDFVYIAGRILDDAR